MKKLKYILLALGALSFASCESWLDEDPQYTINTKVQFSNESNANQALLACYGYMTAPGCYGQFIQALEIAYTGLGWAQTNGQAGDRTARLDADNTQGEIAGVWAGLYKVIGETNAFIANIDESSIDATAKNDMQAQARFLRGLCYYQLTMYWGDVPLKTSPSAVEGVSIKRSPRSEVFNLIISDWQYAYDNMKEGQRDGFISKLGVKAYQGKLYHTMGCLGDASAWDKAKGYFDEVYGKFNLEPKFANLFVDNIKNSKESIFQLNFNYNKLITFNRASWFSSPGSSTAGISFGTFRASKAFYDHFNGTYPDDPRISETFITKWRMYAAGAPAALKDNVETPRDYGFAYPYYAYTIDKEPITPGFKLPPMRVGKLPYHAVANPASPTVPELEAYIASLPEGNLEKKALEGIIKALTDSPATNVMYGWPFYKKPFDPNQNAGQGSHKNVILYRYADLLLMMADVYNELNNKAKAIDLADEVLLRARNSGATAPAPASAQPAKWNSALTKEQVREKIFFERLLEHYGEPEIYARMRMRGTEFLKKILEVNNNHGIIKAAVAKNPEKKGNFGERIFNNGTLDENFLKKNLLYPIPQSEFNANPGLNVATDNNFGY